MGRGVYNEAFDVFIDTTNIIVVENEFNHSITFQIVGKENEKVIENLILNSKPEGGYKAFIAKYDLSSEELLTLLDNEKLLTKKPTTITEVDNYSRIDVGGDGADCIDIEIGTRSVCRNAHGNIIANNGELGNDCVGMPFQQEYLVLTIDAGCLSGGGGGSSPGSGSGSSPGSGTGNSGGGGSGSTGGNPGNPGNPNTGNPPNDGGNNNTPGQQDPSLTDGNGNPIITTPILTVNRTLIKLLNQLDPQQKYWWNTIATETVKSEIIDYLNQNMTNGVFESHAISFINWAIVYLINHPTMNWENIYNSFLKPYPEMGNYTTIDPENIIYETPLTQQSLPSLSDFIESFPKEGSDGNYTQKSASDVYNLVEGSLLYSYNHDSTNAYSNACSIRGSRGLLYSNIHIPVLKYNSSQRTQKGGDGKNYILDTVSFNKFMEDKFGEATNVLEGEAANDPEQVMALLEGKNGIYVIVNNSPSEAGYSGHVDLILNGNCVGGEYLKPVGGVKSIKIWVLN
jgi:hypothetical protein